MSDSYPTVLRDLRMYVTANGKNESMFPTHLYTYRVEDEAGNLVFTNLKEPAEIEQGPVALGYHKALIDWLSRWPHAVVDALEAERQGGNGRDAMAMLDELGATRTLTITTSHGDQFFSAYRIPPEELVATGFRQKDGGLRGHAAWVAHVLVKAEETRVAITCRDAQDAHEQATLNWLRGDGKRRWHAGQQQAAAQFGHGA
jgi:hypothetical protein